MSTLTKAAQLEEIDRKIDAVFEVLWSCFSTESEMLSAKEELDRLRAERKDVEAVSVEPEVIENASAGRISDLVVVFTTVAADPVILDRRTEKSIVRLYASRFRGKEEARGFAEEIRQLLELRRKEAFK